MLRPWWKDDSYCIGVLSQKTRFVKIINTLTSQDQIIEVFINNNIIIQIKLITVKKYFSLYVFKICNMLVYQNEANEISLF